MAWREVDDVVGSDAVLGDSGLETGAKQWMGVGSDVKTIAIAMDRRERERFDFMVALCCLFVVDCLLLFAGKMEILRGKCK